MRTVAIFGTGLIGGSFGLALKAAGFEGEILGVSSPSAIDSALRAGAVDREASPEEAARTADLLFLAQPVRRIIATLGEINALVRPGAIVTDAGSTKAAIMRAAADQLTRCAFIGGHPMAGAEKRGADAASADLFRGRAWVLTPVHEADLHTPAAAALVGSIRRTGARILVMDAAEHDRTVALTSHLPQLVSTALASALNQKNGSPEISVFGPGLIDMTRLALSAFDLWSDVLATNAAAVSSALDFYIAQITLIRDAVAGGDGPALREFFERAQQLASKIRSENSSPDQSLSWG